MKKTEIIVITLTSIVILGGIAYAGVDAIMHPSEANTTEVMDNNLYYYFEDENGAIDTIPKSDTITVPTGYAVIEDGHIVDFIFLDSD